MQDIWYQKEIDDMLKSVVKVSDKQAAKGLFDNILTSREINDMARRLKAIKLLEEGASYGDIRQKLGLSPTTISRLANKVGYGFRRSSSTIKKTSAAKEPARKKTIRYKGAPAFRVNK